MRTSASYTSLYVRFALSKILRIYFALMQSNSANPKSLATYVRSKGLTEQALAEIGYSDTIIYRPGFLKGAERPDFRFLESVFSSVLLLDSFPCDILGLRLISGSPFFLSHQGLSHHYYHMFRTISRSTCVLCRSTFDLCLLTRWARSGLRPRKKHTHQRAARFCKSASCRSGNPTVLGRQAVHHYRQQGLSIFGQGERMMCFPHLCLECMSFPVYNVFTRSALLPLTIRREKTVRGIQTVCESQHRVLSPQTILLSLDQSIVHKMPTFQILQVGSHVHVSRMSSANQV